jgi:3-methyladenine DNA glycosylase AlkD
VIEKARRRKVSRRQLERELAAAGDPERAAGLLWFFKTGPGEYGEGDRFLGIRVPVLRKIALQYRELGFDDIERLLASPIHEHRAAAVEILVAQYARGKNEASDRIFEFYLSHTAGINNWDLVDGSAPYIVGKHLSTRSRRLLDRLAVSKSVWERRIAMIATLALIKKGETKDTFRIARKLLSDPHELIHKAVGWALREAGKVSQAELVEFLSTHFDSLPRTTLRYAIERFPAEERKRMLRGIFS